MAKAIMAVTGIRRETGMAKASATPYPNPTTK